VRLKVLKAKLKANLETDRDLQQADLAQHQDRVLKVRLKVLKVRLKVNLEVDRDTQQLKLWQNLKQGLGLKANRRVLKANLKGEQEAEVLKSSLKLKIHQNQEEDLPLK
jgi:hypothetical protein